MRAFQRAGQRLLFAADQKLSLRRSWEGPWLDEEGPLIK